MKKWLNRKPRWRSHYAGGIIPYFLCKIARVLLKRIKFLNAFLTLRKCIMISIFTVLIKCVNVLNAIVLYLTKDIQTALCVFLEFVLNRECIIVGKHKFCLQDFLTDWCPYTLAEKSPGSLPSHTVS